VSLGGWQRLAILMSGEGCKKHLMLSGMIVHLNDHHEWSREQIANWLDPSPTAETRTTT
jgi:hypothetical protein